MAEAFDVFISYSSADDTWVQKLRTALAAKGIRVWLDKDQIRPGDLFVDALETGIASANCVALVVSPESNRSGWVKEEYHRALVLHSPVRLIPVLLRNAELPGFLSSRKWVDFRDPNRFAQSVDELSWGITGNPSAQDFKPLLQRSPASSSIRHWLTPLVVAISLTLITSIVFREWSGAGYRLDKVESLVVLAFWCLMVFGIDWLWRFLRLRRARQTESN